MLFYISSAFFTVCEISVISKHPASRSSHSYSIFRSFCVSFSTWSSTVLSEDFGSFPQSLEENPVLGP
jgi:hypothetical protein